MSISNLGSTASTRASHDVADQEGEQSEGGVLGKAAAAAGATMGAVQSVTEGAGSVMGALTGAMGLGGGSASSRHFDITLGIDVHPFPPFAGMPFPAPYIGMVFDPFEYLSNLANMLGGDGMVTSVLRALGGSVYVNGRHKTMAGSMSMNIPHIPWVALNQGEVFMGSSTVLVEGEPFTYAALPTLTCWIAGLFAPPRPPKPKKSFSPMLPTTFVIPLPSARPVIVGGPPTISFMSLFMGGLFKVLGKAFKAVARKFRASKLSCMKCVMGAAASLVGNPVDAATGKSLQSDTDFSIDATLPIEFTRVNYGNERGGTLLGDAWFDPWSEHLRKKNGRIEFYTANARKVTFDNPYGIGAVSTNIHAPQNRLRREGEFYVLWNNNQEVHKWFKLFPDGIYRLIKLEDPNGNALKFGYSAPHRDCRSWALRSAHHTDGIDLNIQSDRDGRMLSVERVFSGGAKAELVRYAYNEDGHLARVEKPSGYYETFKYTESGFLKSIGYNGAYFTDYGYDGENRITAIRSDTRFYNDQIIYEPEHGKTVYKDALRRAHTYVFDARDMPISEIDPVGNVFTREWGIMDDLLCETDPLGRKISYEYDQWGQVTRTTYPDETSESFARDEQGRLLKYSDPAGRSWSFEYDAQGNIISETGPDGQTQKYTRRKTGQIKSIHHSNATETHLEYDLQNRLTRVVEWNGAATSYEYSEKGALLARIDAEGGKTHFTYDRGGNVSQVTLADGRSIHAKYDTFGQKTEVTDAQGRRSQYHYGAFNTLEEMRDPMGHSIRFELDPVMRLGTVKNERGEAYRFDYDAADNLLSETDFSGRKLQYRYDAAGQLVASKAADGRRTQFERDIMGRITSQAIEANREGMAHEITKYEFTKTGALSAVSRDGLEVAFKHDKLGRVTSEVLKLTDPHSGEVLREDKAAFTYTSEGERASRSLNGSETHYEYDSDGLMSGLTIGEHTPLGFKRDLLGREILRQSGAGFALTHAFDQLGQLTGQQAGWFDGEAPQPKLRDVRDKHGFIELPGATQMDLPGAKWHVERSYRYDKAFNPIEIKDKNWGTTRYEYDVRDQVTKAAHTGQDGGIREERFSYDATRNIANQQDVLGGMQGAARAVEAARKYSAGGRIERKGDTTFAYDAHGRLVSKRVDKKGFRPQKWKYEWDGEDQLTRVYSPEGHVWDYDYDPFGRRIGKRCVKGQVEKAPAEVAYLWDGNLLSGEKRIYADGSESAVEYHYEQGSFVPMAQEVDGVLSYIIPDQIGTPREMCSEDGELVWGRRHKLWGGTEEYLHLKAANDNAGMQDCLIRFQGQIEDAETGLYYNRFRYYDADGGYISSDPIGLMGGGQLSGYINTPTILVDPFGLSGIWGSLVAGPYSDVKGHHLNQDAAFRDVIPHADGISTPLSGNVFSEPGTPHFEAHKSMESFWDKYRRGGPLAGTKPSNADFDRALRNSLLAAGMPPVHAHQLADMARKQRLTLGLFDSMEVPRIPGRINSVRKC